MRSLLHTQYGEASELLVGTTHTPTPGKGEVLIQVAAASVNAADVFSMRGVPRPIRTGRGLMRPKVNALGLDVAGTVVSLGPDVTQWAIGDRVFGQGFGTFAEHAVASADTLARVPDGVSAEHAATLPVAGITALRGLRLAQVSAGQRVVVTGAAGGVGQFAAQLAALEGAHVIAVCSGRNVERVRALGIDTVLDYETQDVLATDQPYDVVFDNAGAISIRDWRRVVRRGGTILPNSGVKGPDGGALMRVAKAQWHRLLAPQRVRTFMANVTRAELEELGAHLAAGRITPLIDTMFTLDHAPEALARVATHHARGKVLVTMA